MSHLKSHFKHIIEVIWNLNVWTKFFQFFLNQNYRSINTLNVFIRGLALFCLLLKLECQTFAVLSLEVVNKRFSVTNNL